MGAKTSAGHRGAPERTLTLVATGRTHLPIGRWTAAATSGIGVGVLPPRKGRLTVDWWVVLGSDPRDLELRRENASGPALAFLVGLTVQTVLTSRTPFWVFRLKVKPSRDRQSGKLVWPSGFESVVTDIEFNHGCLSDFSIDGLPVSQTVRCFQSTEYSATVDQTLDKSLVVWRDGLAYRRGSLGRTALDNAAGTTISESGGAAQYVAQTGHLYTSRHRCVELIASYTSAMPLREQTTIDVVTPDGANLGLLAPVDPECLRFPSMGNWKPRSRPLS